MTEQETRSKRLWGSRNYGDDYDNDDQYDNGEDNNDDDEDDIDVFSKTIFCRIIIIEAPLEC